MATFYTPQVTGILDGTATFTRGNSALLGGRIHAIVGTLVLAAQAAGSVIVFGEIPKGAVPLKVTLESDTSLSTATVSIGSTASAAKYSAAAVFTATDTPTGKMKTTAVGVATTAVETLAITTATAALPGSGNLAVIFEYMLPEGG